MRPRPRTPSNRPRTSRARRNVSAQRNAFTQARLDQLLGFAPGSHGYLALDLYRFDPKAGPLALGADGPRVAATTATGRIEALVPSTLLAAVHDEAARPLLGA